MNKIFTKIAAVTVGLAMALGVGVGVAINKQAMKVDAASHSFSFSRSDSSDTVTNGYSLTLENAKSATDYYQDKSSSVGLDLLLEKSDSSALWTTAPVSNSLTVKVGGGSTRDPLTNNVLAYLVDSNGNNINSSETIVTTKVETTTGKDYTVSFATVPSSAYGLRISHAKETSYNVRVYSISFTYEDDEDEPVLTQLDAPVISKNETVISWANVEDNNGYSYSITGDGTRNGNLAADTTSLDISTLSLAYGNYSISIIAKGDGVTTSDSDASNSVQFTLSEPTVSGNFNLFSGSLVEGDYIVYYNGYSMKNTIVSNRFSYSSVTPVNDTISNPAVSIVWHIAKDGDYWTLYNAAVEKYAGGTTTKNQGALLESVTDYAKWTVTGSSTYQFENKGRAEGASDTGNKWLRNNGDSGFACYSSSTGGALSLYKKYVPFTVQYNANGGTGEMANSETVVSACSFTAPSGKEFDHWNTAANNSGASYNPGQSVNAACTLYAIWRDLVPSVSINKDAVDLTIGGSPDTVTATPTNIDNPSYSWARVSGDDCVSLSNANTATVTISVGNEISRISTCVVRLTVNGQLGGNNITPITKDVAVTILRDSSPADPYTVAEARIAIDKLQPISDACVAGIVSQVDSYSSTYHSITYWISDDGTTNNQLQVYSGKGVENADFSKKEDIETGASVVVKGTLKLHNTTYEFDYNNIQLSYTPGIKYTVSFEPNGGSSVASQQVVANQKAVQPDNPSKDPTELYSYSFGGWYEDSGFEGDPYDFNTPVTHDLVLYAKWNESLLPARQVIESAVNTGSSLSYSGYTKNVNNSTGTDTLTRAETGVDGNSYSGWTYTDPTSGISYAGNSAGGNASIQLRSNTNSGIVITANNNHFVKGITVVWNTNTADGRTLDLFGKNSAYSATSDLYGDADAKGTSIGSLVLDKNDDSLTASIVLPTEHQFKYIGLKSNNNAHYIESIEIEWGVCTTYTFDSLKIRFSAKVSESLWERLDSESHIEGYGMLLTTAEHLGNAELKNSYNSAVEYTSSPDVTSTVVKFSNTKAEPNLSDGFYGWSLHKSIGSSDLATEYVAVAYIVTEEHGVVFLSETRASAKSLASGLLQAGTYEEDAFGGSLKYLADL